MADAEHNVSRSCVHREIFAKGVYRNNGKENMIRWCGVGFRWSKAGWGRLGSNAGGLETPKQSPGHATCDGTCGTSGSSSSLYMRQFLREG